MEEKSAAARAVCSNTRLRDLVRDKRNLLQVDSRATLRQALSLFREHRVLSLPVLDSALQVHAGILNLMDVLAHTAFASTGATDAWLTAVNRSLDDTPCEELLGASAESSRLWSFAASATVDAVLPHFGSGRVHRALVQFDPATDLDATAAGAAGDAVAKMLSQGDLLRFLVGQEALLGETFARSLADLGLVGHRRRPAATLEISEATTALDAFREMHRAQVSALALLAPSDSPLNTPPRLAANLSASDLRFVFADLTRLLMPVATFVRAMQDEAANNGQQSGPAPAAGSAAASFGFRFEPLKFRGEGTTLRQVCQALLERKVHRAWVVDEQDAAVGAITATDILAVFAPSLSP